jgi:hypothetical protein
MFVVAHKGDVLGSDFEPGKSKNSKKNNSKNAKRARRFSVISALHGSASEQRTSRWVLG